MAVDPDTVLKASRETEHEGLAAARPGAGTVVTRTPAEASPAAHGLLSEDRQRWALRDRDPGVPAGGVAGPVARHHHRLTGPRRDPDGLPAGRHGVTAGHTDRQTTLLARTDTPVHDLLWTVGPARPGSRRPGPHAPARRRGTRHPTRAGGTPTTWPTWRRFRRDRHEGQPSEHDRTDRGLGGPHQGLQDADRIRQDGPVVRQEPSSPPRPRQLGPRPPPVSTARPPDGTSLKRSFPMPWTAVRRSWP